MLADAPRGMGWERTIAKFADPASSAEDFVDPLTEALREHERAVGPRRDGQENARNDKEREIVDAEHGLDTNPIF